MFRSRCWFPALLFHLGALAGVQVTPGQVTLAAWKVRVRE